MAGHPTPTVVRHHGKDYINERGGIMSAQVVQAFPIEKSNNSWKKGVLEFLNKRLDQIAEETTMEKIEDITGAIFRNKSEILGQMTLGFIKKKYCHLLNQEYCNCPKCNKRIIAWNKKAKRTCLCPSPPGLACPQRSRLRN